MPDYEIGIALLQKRCAKIANIATGVNTTYSSE